MRLIILAYLTILIGCSNNRTDNQITYPDNSTNEQEHIDSITSKPEPKTEVTNLSLIDSLRLKADSSEWHFHFKFLNSSNEPIDFFSGYNEYDENKYGFQNPAYLKAFINERLVFEETFKAYEHHWMDSVGTYEFSDKLDFYKLNYGLEAHDYVVAERLISINDHTIQIVDEFDFQATMFASNYTEYIFPTDSGGQANMLITIDKIDYRTEEEPNIADTTFYLYVNAEFKKKR